eukprot:CAMPEP_0169105010 /NCGR_PEP_ID=MMETSP1015-20121227/23563_1 /TAXON_ID=342587 /ORGANISM="Karlodinium micrum, Strain CCMP2283" /LENGTH=85 /DNA_ID=CAMNT_0009166331 /DNA_START=218 /DNA_END=475 /DNA_ORIENTATION=-
MTSRSALTSTARNSLPSIRMEDDPGYEEWKKSMGYDRLTDMDLREQEEEDQAIQDAVLGIPTIVAGVVVIALGFWAYSEGYINPA